MLLKLDIARAFDSVSWPFLLETLQHLGFGQRWRDWISILLSTASTRVMINGHPGPPIDHACGRRQGDPVSPMLFTIVIDVLNSMLIRAVELGLIQWLTTRHAASSISLYADDVVVFCRPDHHDIFAVRELLRVFGLVSGLHTNYSKCSATPIQCNDEDIATIAAEMQCPVKQFPIQYLGLPLSIRKPSTTSLMPIIHKLERKLSTWRASLLS
uniref:Reverse transcriptase domain-containing protein n=1 Tax=Triticum urartu TaxID=4572 RepID=A0A8R7TKT7_TRIUA